MLDGFPRSTHDPWGSKTRQGPSGDDKRPLRLREMGFGDKERTDLRGFLDRYHSIYKYIKVNII